MNIKENDNLFANFSRDYDRMINWEERLRREAPFFTKVFRDVGAKRLLDTACGTGRHAIMFSELGLNVAAADISAEMITAAESNAHNAGSQIEFGVAGLGAIDTVFKPEFDVITCLGNSLPHLKTKTELITAFSAAAGLLRKNGAFIIQLRNYQRIYARNERFMPLNNRVEENGEYLYLRMSELGQEYVTFNIIVMAKDSAGKWSYRVESEKLKPWMLADIEEACNIAGFTVTDRYGDYAFSPFDPMESADLIITARRN